MKRRIGKYELIGPLGTGGMAVVYRAKDTSLERIVALKLMRQQIDGGDIARKRFLNEARVLAGLQHSNIVFVYDFGIEDGLPFIVMEYLPGADLHELIQKQYPLQIEEKLKIAIQVAKALRCAHGLGVVHRDIKPSNIRVLQDGVAKLMDFGIATILSQELERLTQTGSVLGSIRYMAPEQIHGRTVTTASDLFSFGAVLYELLTYRAAFLGDSLGAVVSKITHEEPPPIDDPEVPPRLRALVEKCLRKVPAERFPNVDALLRALSAVEEELWERAMQEGSTHVGRVLLSDAAPLPVPEEQETVIVPPAEPKDDTLQRPTRNDVAPWKKPTRKVPTPDLELVSDEIQEDPPKGWGGVLALMLAMLALAAGVWFYWGADIARLPSDQEVVVLRPVGSPPSRSAQDAPQRATPPDKKERPERPEAGVVPEARRPEPREQPDPTAVGRVTPELGIVESREPARPEATAAITSDPIPASESNPVDVPAAESTGTTSLETWIASLHRRSGAERLAAARALAGSGRAAVDPLASALRSPDVEVRMLAATALGQIGPVASSAVPALNEAAADPSALVRVWANYALARIDWRDPAAMAALRRSEGDADEQVRDAARRALANLERR